MAYTFTMISPIPDLTVIARSGNSYTADAAGVITSVASNDYLDLAQAGCKLGGNLTNRISLLEFHNTTGATLGATATAGALGFALTAGTSFALVGEATSSSAKTDVGMAEYILPSSYIAGTNINLIVNSNYTGSGTVTGASCSVTPTVYPETDAGVQTANICSAVQLITGTAADLTFTLTGTNLTPGQRILISLSLLVTSASGANTGQINSVRVQLP